jgi:hypothetical protein
MDGCHRVRAAPCWYRTAQQAARRVRRAPLTRRPPGQPMCRRRRCRSDPPGSIASRPGREQDHPDPSVAYGGGDCTDAALHALGCRQWQRALLLKHQMGPSRLGHEVLSGAQAPYLLQLGTVHGARACHQAFTGPGLHGHLHHAGKIILLRIAVADEQHDGRVGEFRCRRVHRGGRDDRGPEHAAAATHRHRRAFNRADWPATAAPPAAATASPTATPGRPRSAGGLPARRRLASSRWLRRPRGFRRRRRSSSGRA